jgi:hypothetical protein
MTAWRSLLGVVVILIVSWDAFETILLPPPGTEALGDLRGAVPSQRGHG